jgi:hypothetical protein
MNPLLLIEMLLAPVLGLTACSSAEVTAIVATTNAIVGIVPLIAQSSSIITPAEQADIAAAVAVIQPALTALASTVQSYQKGKSTLQDVTDAFAAVQANMTPLLKAAHVKDAATAAKIQGIVALAAQSLTAVEATLNAQAAGVKPGIGGSPVPPPKVVK